MPKLPKANSKNSRPKLSVANKTTMLTMAPMTINKPLMMLLAATAWARKLSLLEVCSQVYKGTEKKPPKKPMSTNKPSK